MNEMKYLFDGQSAQNGSQVSLERLQDRELHFLRRFAQELLAGRLQQLLGGHYLALCHSRHLRSSINQARQFNFRFLNRLTLGRLTVSGTPCAVSTCSQTGFSVITWIFKNSSSYHTFMIHKQKYVSIHLQRVGNIRWTNGRSPLIKRWPWKI